jgi:tRNA threonylcarbamoyladenosine biosynthesis protein TsaB
VLILGIGTSTDQIGCAIGGHEGVIASFELRKGRRHAETLAPAIQFLCDQSGISLSQLGLVAVDVGPGLFTGLRVGMATAHAIAYGLSLPMIGVSSLDLLAFPARMSNRLIAAVLDARRGELYYSLYRPVPGGVQRVTDHKVCAPAEVASHLVAVGEEVLLVGDGAHKYREEFASVGRAELADPSLSFPSATALVRLAHARALREDFARAAEVQPLYLRSPDAEINWTTRHGETSSTRSARGSGSDGGA